MSDGLSKVSARDSQGQPSSYKRRLSSGKISFVCRTVRFACVPLVKEGPMTHPTVVVRRDHMRVWL